MEYLKNLLEQLNRSFGALPTTKKVFIAVTVLLTVASLVGLISWTSRVDYKTLYTGLGPEDSGAIIAWLKDQKVEYRIAADGSSIMVPSDMVYELRMSLASQGLPQSSGIGYEIFDQQNIGVTEFVQKVNYRRALQGELARTVKQFSEVRNARVHLSIPEKTLFLDQQEQPRASVVLTLYPGKRLRPAQVQGITHLVASSVPGLDPENVNIVDSHGKLIAGGREPNRYADQSQTQQQLQYEMEQTLTRKIETMLGSVVGAGKVTARVAVELDFTQVERTEENYDPERSAVRSEQRLSEKSSGSKPVAAGVPGVMSNTPDLEGGGAAGASSTDYKKSNETINYEISRVTKRVVTPIGTVKRLSAAVLIDGTYDAAEGDSSQRQYVPRTPAEMKKYEALVKQALGYDEDRGDSVEVVNVEFHDVTEQIPGTLDRLVDSVNWQSIVYYLVTALLFALFFIFALKPMLRIVGTTLEAGRGAPALSAAREEGTPGEELPSGMFEGEMERLSRQQSDIQAFAQKNPRLFAQYLKNWLQ